VTCNQLNIGLTGRKRNPPEENQWLTEPLLAQVLNMKTLQNNAILRAWLCAGALALAAGCATSKTGKTTYYFYPPAPDEPRIQFLTSFSSQRGLRGGDDRTFLNYITGTAQPEKALAKPYGGAGGHKRFYVCDTDMSAVLVAELETRHLRGVATTGDATLKIPLNLAVDADGSLFIVDSGRDQVVVLDKDEKFVTALGKAGEMKPRDVAVSNDRLYVADLLGRSVRVYDKKDYSLQFTIPRPQDRTNDERRLYTPTNLGLDSKGRIYVSDTGASAVMIYEPDGQFVRRVGGVGDSLGQFARVKGIALDRANRLYAVDAMSQAVQVFDEKGELLMWFAEPDTGNKMQDLPAKVFVDYDDVEFFEKYASPNFKVEHLVVVINQIGPRKVSVFGFGHKK
jgi:hypothetical protein